MSSRPLNLRNDALRIWQAGLAAVRSDRLMQQAVRVEAGQIVFRAQAVDLRTVHRIAVVGAGKAGAGMATGLESILGPKLAEEKQLTGWVNIPADCIPNREGKVHLHAARPAGVNEPTAAGIEGTQRILEIVSSLGDSDLCIVLLSGGGSSLMPAPIEGISLADKIAVTRFLSAAGADIRELNTLRKQLSHIKGGGLARACRAGRIVVLVISDVLSDPLDLIASGPTVENLSSPQDALEVLDRFHARESAVPQSVFDVLQRKAAIPTPPEPIRCRVSHHIIGNNATAVNAAAEEAKRFGYATQATWASNPEGDVEYIGPFLAKLAISMHDNKAERRCFISGGEGTVKLAPENMRGLGGRNQQAVLAALQVLAKFDPRGIAILSAGTDGEDGPTDAAGAFVDYDVIEAAKRLKMNAADYLGRNDAYHFFEPLGALIKTGPTNTNVCDVRVVVTAGGSEK